MFWKNTLILWNVNTSPTGLRRQYPITCHKCSVIFCSRKKKKKSFFGQKTVFWSYTSETLFLFLLSVRQCLGRGFPVGGANWLVWASMCWLTVCWRLRGHDGQAGGRADGRLRACGSHVKWLQSLCALWSSLMTHGSTGWPSLLFSQLLSSPLLRQLKAFTCMDVCT